jgi:hypothetical protein
MSWTRFFTYFPTNGHFDPLAFMVFTIVSDFSSKMISAYEVIHNLKNQYFE